MNSRFTCTSVLLLLACLLPNFAHSATCYGVGDTLTEAKESYATSCSLPALDCDPVAGKWYCSSGDIDTNTIFSLSNMTPEPDAPSINSSIVQPVELTTSDLQTCIDSDGDGWGWNGQSSCEVDIPDNTPTPGTGTGTGTGTVTGTAATSESCRDTDGDGWGWNGHSSCRVETTAAPTNVPEVLTRQNQTTSQTTAQTTSQVTNEATNQTSSQISGDCRATYNPSDITDLVLVTGQSNVTGAQTSVSATLDRWGRVTEFHAPDESHPRVFAWTVDPNNNNAGTGWQVASLNQSWHDSAPGVGGIARNNFAFHFAKKVAEQPGCRVVGFVMVSEGGKGIAHWDYNAPGWVEVVRHVTEAMSAIGRSTIDGILWHQGESDWITDGTCYGSDRCQNNQPDYYAQKLYSEIADKTIPNSVNRLALIDRLRNESWYSAGKPFIAGETIKAPVNIHLNKLNADSDRWTACIDSDQQSGLGIRADDPFKNHYNAEGLRELGARYAAEYLNMTN